MDPEVLTALGFAYCHTTKPADRLVAAHVDSFRSTPNCSHKQLARLTSLSFVRVGTKAVSNFCFQNLVAKNVHLVAMMRLVFGF